MRRRDGITGIGMLSMGEMSAVSLGGGYFNKVLGYNPLAYWPLWETSGTVARCLVNTLQNGTYARDVSVMGTATGIGDGNSAPVFDGTNDVIDVETATLTGALDTYGANSTVAFWGQVSAAGVWADGTWRYFFRLWDNGNNRFTWGKSTANNRLYSYWVGGGVVEEHTENGVADTTWMHFVMTRNEVADEVKYYRNSILLATGTVIGNWASGGGWADAVIGASSAALLEPWDGQIAHFSLFPSVLEQADVDALYSV